MTHPLLDNQVLILKKRESLFLRSSHSDIFGASIYAGSMKIATDTIGGESNGGTNPACTPPTNGDWTVTTSCTFTGIAAAPANVIVNASAVLTIDGTATLKIDMKQYKLLVKKDGGVLVKKGGAVKQGIGNATGGYTGIVYHSTDHLSGSNVDTDGSGTIIELQEYYPFGNVRMDEKTSSFTNDYKYTGKELDEDTNLYYYGARYYDASIGRFVSMDPIILAITAKQLINSQALNTYSYTLNNPLKYIDPDGKDPISIIFGALFGFFTGAETANAPGPQGPITISNLTPQRSSYEMLAEISANEIIGFGVGKVVGKVINKGINVVKGILTKNTAKESIEGISECFSKTDEWIKTSDGKQMFTGDIGGKSTIIKPQEFKYPNDFIPPSPNGWAENLQTKMGSENANRLWYNADNPSQWVRWDQNRNTGGVFHTEPHYHNSIDPVEHIKPD